MTCLKHQQNYSEGEYCIYCGNPIKITTSSTSTSEVKITDLSDRELLLRWRECIRQPFFTRDYLQLQEEVNKRRRNPYFNNY